MNTFENNRQEIWLPKPQDLSLSPEPCEKARTDSVQQCWAAGAIESLVFSGQPA